MDKEYLKGRLLAGLPIYADKIPIYSPLLKDIFEIGESKYNECLRKCIIGKENIKGFSDPNTSNFDVLFYFLVNDQINPQEVIEALYFFTKLKFDFKITEDCNDLFFVSNEVVLSRNNYDDFISLIKFANLINIEEKKNIKRNSELDKKIEEAKRKISKQLNKKTDSKDNIDLLDLISVLASKHNSLNILNIWDLSIYRFDNQFKRMQLIENYDIGIKSLLAGAKKEDVKLEHYIKKIKQ